MALSRISNDAAMMASWRRAFHQRPELDLSCHQTAHVILDLLKGFGVDEIAFGAAESGVIATIDSQRPGPTTALRADMDALPIAETSGVAWSSTRPDVMHACGHDGHMAMLLGAAKYLCETRNFAGKVVLIFQPGEEMSGGGRIMVEEGVLDRFGVEQIFALHTMPNQPFGTLFTRPGPFLSSVDDFAITITGRGGHVAQPAQCKNPVDHIPAVLGGLQDIQRDLALTGEKGVLATTVLQTGRATNVIPSSISVGGTVRCLDAGLRNRAEAAILALKSDDENAYALSATYTRFYPALVNNLTETEYAVEVACALVGREKVNARMEPQFFSEDFAYMLNAKPGCLIALGQGDGPGLHDASFDFNDQVAPIGAAFLARLVEARG